MGIVRQLRNWLEQDAAKLVFQLVAFATASLLLVSLTRELLLNPSPDEKRIAAIVASLFVAAFLAAYGKEVAGRIKKIGPLEIAEARKAVRELDEIAKASVDYIPGEDPGVAVDVSAEGYPIQTHLTETQSFYYVEGERFLTYLKFSGTEPESGEARDVFWELLYKIGIMAMRQREWLKAIRWLKHLEKVSKAAYKPSDVNTYLAFSNLFVALRETGLRREIGLKEATDRFKGLAAKGELAYIGYFWLAYAQDELKQWFEATLSNLETLSRRPRFAPARYNLAISLLKLRKYGNAYWQLKSIGADDEQIEIVTAGVAGDQEMKRCIAEVDDLAARRRLLAELERLRVLGTKRSTS
jgi:hypothetical protein